MAFFDRGVNKELCGAITPTTGWSGLFHLESFQNIPDPRKGKGANLLLFVNASVPFHEVK